MSSLYKECGWCRKDGIGLCSIKRNWGGGGDQCECNCHKKASSSSALYEELTIFSQNQDEMYLNRLLILFNQFLGENTYNLSSINSISKLIQFMYIVQTTNRYVNLFSLFMDFLKQHDKLQFQNNTTGEYQYDELIRVIAIAKHIHDLQEQDQRIQQGTAPAAPAATLIQGAAASAAASEVPAENLDSRSFEAMFRNWFISIKGEKDNNHVDFLKKNPEFEYLELLCDMYHDVTRLPDSDLGQLLKNELIKFTHGLITEFPNEEEFERVFFRYYTNSFPGMQDWHPAIKTLEELAHPDLVGRYALQVHEGNNMETLREELVNNLKSSEAAHTLDAKQRTEFTNGPIYPTLANIFDGSGVPSIKDKWIDIRPITIIIPLPFNPQRSLTVSLYATKIVEDTNGNRTLDPIIGITHMEAGKFRLVIGMNVDNDRVIYKSFYENMTVSLGLKQFFKLLQIYTAEHNTFHNLQVILAGHYNGNKGFTNDAIKYLKYLDENTGNQSFEDSVNNSPEFLKNYKKSQLNNTAFEFTKLFENITANIYTDASGNQYPQYTMLLLKVIQDNLVQASLRQNKELGNPTTASTVDRLSAIGFLKNGADKVSLVNFNSGSINLYFRGQTAATAVTDIQETMSLFTVLENIDVHTIIQSLIDGFQLHMSEKGGGGNKSKMEEINMQNYMQHFFKDASCKFSCHDNIF